MATDKNIPDRAIIPEKGRDARMKQIRERYSVMQSFWSGIHERAREDDRFVAGEQWSEDVLREREEEGRPALTYNLLQTFCNQIVNQIRQDWPQIRIKPVESDKQQTKSVENVQGTKDYSYADLYMGIIRNIEHISRAEHAYDTSVEHSTQHGFGYFRAMPVYNSDDTFDQDIKIRRVRNSYSVYMDPSAEEADFSDAQDAFVFMSMDKTAFERKYPNADQTALFGGDSNAQYEGWFQKDKIRVAEYLWIEYKKEKIYLLSDGRTVGKEAEPVLDELAEQGVDVIRERTVRRPRCMWQKMTGTDVLEGPTEIPTRYIPIFPVLGKEILLESGRVDYQSAIRNAKDAQKSYNFWKTAAAESVSSQTKAPWLATPQQIKGFEGMWETANNKNLPYLLYNPADGVAPPQRVAPANIASAELAQASQDKDDMQAIIGLFEANLGADGNERSGRAIEARQSRGDLSTFTFPDNLSRAIQHLGRVLIEMIPEIYDTERVMRIRLADDSEDFVTINESQIDEETGEVVYIHDIAYGKYDAVIDTGPSYQTQRQESQDAILDLFTKLPPDKAALTAHLMVKNMDFAGSDEVYEILRKTLPDELKSEDEKARDLPKGYIFNESGEPVSEETGEPLPPPPPTPEQQMAEAEIKAKMADAEAKMAKSEAEKAKAEAMKLQAQADMAEAQAKMAELQQEQPDTAGAIQELEQRLQEYITNHAKEVDEKITEGVVDALNRVQRTYGPKLEALSNDRQSA